MQQLFSWCAFRKKMKHTSTILYNRMAKLRNENLPKRAHSADLWQPAGPVWLNPETEISAPEIRDAA
jgi:hypothetical protein